jgi:ATP-dependent Zn protease
MDLSDPATAGGPAGDGDLAAAIAASSDAAIGAPGAASGRRPLAMWDRLKFLILLGAVFLFAVAAEVSGNPLMTWSDAMRIQSSTSWWLLALLGIEAVRQVHILVAEHWPAYHVFWTERVFGRMERRLLRLNDWNRYRVSRALKWALGAALCLFVYARVEKLSVFDALVGLPGALRSAVPMVVQVVLLLFVVVGQFVAIFWFLSKGGVEVYYPEDIKTRFSDVWGQDHVVSRVRENVFYLERPDEIESRGGYVPGGILLWGPPGTGKTLIAEAVAGETGKPYVFVDPGAFEAMFMGVGVMKVKSLFRRLRKLSLRYGGVIAFFDEADSLGNRGQLASGFGRGGTRSAGAGTGTGFGGWARPGAVFGAGGWQPASTSSVASSLAGGLGVHTTAGCNGLSYLTGHARAQVLRDNATGRWPGAAGAVANGAAAGGPAEAANAARNDVIMGGMGGMGGGGGMGTLQALLTEMSGLKKPRGFLNRVVRRTLGLRPKPPPKYRILIMMATNMPQSLDEALLRPGRIDRQYEVGYPSKQGRIRTFEGYLAKVRHELTEDQIERLAVMSPEATGATIKDTVNEALVQAIKDGREVIGWQDMLRARVVKEYGLADDHEHVERERHSIALHEACHAVVAYRMQRGRVIDLATIERRGGVGGFVAHVALEDRMFMWKSEIEVQVMVSLASLAGERMFFDGDNTVGVGGDLRAATLMVSHHVSSSGMGDTLASRLSMIEQGMGESSIDIDRPFGEQVEVTLRALYQRTEDVLIANRREVLALTHALETHKTINGEDVEAIMEGRMGVSLDGRRYHEPEFLAVAEDYHSSAVRAHRGHSHDLHELPVLGRVAASRPSTTGPTATGPSVS